MGKIMQCRLPAVMAVLLLISGPAMAGTDFGSDQDVRSLAGDLAGFIRDKGVPATVAALKDKTSPFGGARPGVMFFVDGKVAGHNRYPELIGLDLATIQDLRGTLVSTAFTEAADKGGDYTLHFWPHYDTEKEYEWHCLVSWVESRRIMTAICR